MEEKIFPEYLDRRIRKIGNQTVLGGPVVYWMTRDLRAVDNWSLIAAIVAAEKLQVPIRVTFCLRENLMPFSGTRRLLDFLLTGLAETETALARLGIGFDFLTGNPEQTVPLYLKSLKASLVITDFSPLRINRFWIRSAAETSACAVYETDAHNIIPAWTASGKREYGAYTIRPKIHALLPEYLTDFPKLHPLSHPLRPKTDWTKIRRTIKADETVRSPKNFTPGTKAGLSVFAAFLTERLGNYAAGRNNPLIEAQSGLSPYLHFGQVSAQRIAYETANIPKTDSRTAFLEELVVRRELADNYCLYTPDYDSPDGFPDWARKTLREHGNDPRPYTYRYLDLAAAITHDPAWNAAQTEMTETGKMHGYMRMYWAKKILEWTPDAATAMDFTVRLNDRYELDGRDPNGYAGIAWAIGGVHDRPWGRRPVFGLIRYMNQSGLKRKFPLQKYITRWTKP